MALAFASAGSTAAADRTEIAFFDVETSVPQREGQGYALLEFGAILVCPRRLVEVASFSMLVRPADDFDAAAAIPAAGRCNGITREAIASAPPFRDVADVVYDILHGRVWAGHNIVRFDARIIRKAFADIGRPAPEPKGMIDTYTILFRCFGIRAGDMKLATLANYFGLGRQSHRSLDDVRMNLQVLKCCSTVLLLSSHASSSSQEASPPEVSPVTNMLKYGAFPDEAAGIANGSIQGTTGEPDDELAVSIADAMQLVDAATVQMAVDPSSINRYYNSIFLGPDDVSTECIKISVELLHHSDRRRRPRTIIQHKGAELQLRCVDLKVRFGVSAKFLSVAGWPKLSVVVGIPDNLSKVLEFCDRLASESSPEAVGTSEWRPLVTKDEHENYRPTVRLNIPTIDAATYLTDIWKKERNGTTQKLVFEKVDVEELNSLLQWSMLDAFFSLELYDYHQQNAGIRLVAKRLVVHSR